MKRLLLPSLLLCSGKLFSQADSLANNSTTISYDTTTYHAFYVKTAPFTLLDVFNGTSLNLTVESFPVRRISVSPEMGFYMPVNTMGFRHLSGWRSGLEIRYYYKFLYDNIGSESQFIGIRYLHKNQSFSYSDSIDIQPASYSKSYKLSKSVDIGDFVWGLRYLRVKGMEKEFYMGVGVRYKEAICDTLTDDEATARYWGDDTNIKPRLLGCGESVTVDFLIGFKLGFGFK